MIEGYTDATGNPDDNLSLSDRRAEAAAVALTEQFQVPAENLVTQGYGAEYLKIPTDGPERLNRRVAVRRITPLIDQQAAERTAPAALRTFDRATRDRATRSVTLSPTGEGDPDSLSIQPREVCYLR